MYIRVKDRKTGHEYDIREERLDPDKHKPLNRRTYPPTHEPRRPKHYISKGGKPAAPKQSPVDTEQGATS